MRLREILRAKQQHKRASSTPQGNGASSSSDLRSSANGGSSRGGRGPQSPTPSESPSSSSSASEQSDQIIEYLRSVVGKDEANRLMRSCIDKKSPADAFRFIAEAIGSSEGKRQ